MGCAASRLEDEEAVKMCRDRRDLIKQALEQHNLFASSPWDFFWNPFSSLDSFTYPRPRSSYDNVVTDDELVRLQRVREEEGIPELEEEDDECQEHVQMDRKEEKEEHDNADDDEDDDEDDGEECEHSDECMVSNVNFDANMKQETKGFESKGIQCTEAPEPCKTVELEIKAHKKELMRNRVANAEETPGFIVYLNRRPASLVEAMKDIDCQFSGICDAARKISVMLDASRAQYSTSNDLSAKMLNPVALLRSASSHSSSSRFLLAPSSSIDDLFDNETSSCYSEESCSTMSGSHHSTLDRLYTWEKKLYKEVKLHPQLMDTDLPRFPSIIMTKFEGTQSETPNGGGADVRGAQSLPDVRVYKNNNNYKQQEQEYAAHHLKGERASEQSFYDIFGQMVKIPF
ncbi:hypothetical protein ACJX0J_037809 [Zea mays]